MTVLDPAAIMAAHEQHVGFCGAVSAFVNVDPRGPHCLPYLLAAALAAAREREASAWDEGWNAADEEGVLIHGIRIPTPQGNPYRAALAGEGAADRCNEPDPSDSTAEGCSNRPGHGPDKGHLWSGEGAADQPQGEPRRWAPERECRGDYDCLAIRHIHGCYADLDGDRCDDPGDHR